MPDAAVAPAQAGAGQPGAPAPAPQTNFIFTILRAVAFWWFAQQFMGPKKITNPSLLSKNLVQKGTELDMWVYISEHPVFRDFRNEEALVWQESGVPYGSWKPEGERRWHLSYTPTESVKNNGSVFAHIFFAVSGVSPDPSDSFYNGSQTWRATAPLTVYQKRPKVERRLNLLGGSTTGEAEPVVEEVVPEKPEGADGEGATLEEDLWGNYWRPNLTICLVDEHNPYPQNGIPPQLSAYMQFDHDSGNYYPITYLNDFWILKQHLIAVNETVEVLPLDLWLSPISTWRWQLYVQTEKSFSMQEAYGGMMDGGADQVKRIFLEGNPYLLGITLVVSMLHSVFDFLAFKNDIQFWRANKSMEGLSARTIIINFFCQLVIFLYLLDNETSWLIICSSGVGVIIEFWKIGKAMNVKVDWKKFPFLSFQHRDSYTKSRTQEYDAIAMKYLAYGLYPCVLGYSIYSLLYSQHKSWYSWVLSSLTGCVYTFGFIMMCPQLFINYKLKSVAHLPWRQMTYKFLNTIIDDLSAFIIKMPTLHRLSVFRDDVIFLIYVYQRWIYPVDKKRVNEFGFGGAEALGEGAEGVAVIPPDEAASQLIEDTPAATETGTVSKTAAGKRAEEAQKEEVKDGAAEPKAPKDKKKTK